MVDNFSMRGNSGMTLSKVPDSTLAQFAAIRPYDLIVLQFGLNVANTKQSDYSGYAKEMEAVVKKLAKAFPQASILVVGVGDRGEKKAGGIVTMGGIKALGRAQQQLAFRTGCAFWNLYQGMGGPGSIVKMAEGKPALANKDYTHINSKGGEFVAKRLFDALIHGYEERKGKQK
jgi:lysophospholipase L1-like esterase